ncbi:trypsin-like peptidase domain-containing protein [Virgisporangium aurantiacum]|uniref:Trypsin-like peptidase domain-containing protein n=1 Tax=Virgisporangium aurantiacum TaxID=175570 RepID=A0A8J4DXW2_9ACTN|nr:trypsin-like peptidase domain-containing protein [Virgisporangium aurantiacum]GIJ55000.1 hypothetical protein Vau01_025160 [Virgisporangium aurantiacum]
MKTTGIRRQRLREITVEVRDAHTGEAAGTGVLVSADGLAVTCAHVVEACGVDPRELHGDDVLVRLPQTPLHPAIDRLAKVIWHPLDHDDDLVVLELAGGPVPPERVGICGPAGEDADGQPFQSWGFRLRGDYTKGLMARGLVDAHVPSERNYLYEPLQLTSAQLDSGMSGSAVLDIARNLVIGFVFRVWEPGESPKDRDLAFAVDAGLLAHSPLADTIVTTSVPLGHVAQPVLHQGLVMPPTTEATLDQQPVLNEPPSHLGAYVGRESLLTFLTEAWADPGCKLTGLFGPSGIGKTSLVRQWLGKIGANDEADGPSVFWWTFDPAKQEEDDFLVALIGHLSGGALKGATIPSSAAKANLAAYLLQTVPRVIIVLDDLSSYQMESGDLYGCFQHSGIKDFVNYLISADQRTLAILTSDLPFPELENVPGVVFAAVEPLNADEGMRLLTMNGVHGDEATLHSIVADWGGHPQALTAVAIYLRTRHLGDARFAGDLPLGSADGSFADRLLAIGEAIQERRSQADRAALEVLALARGPLPADVLSRILARLAGTGHIPAAPSALGDLLRSAAVRESTAGFIPHPVLRNLYRTRLRKAPAEYLIAAHRLLANHYYAIGV